ncbi:hypothetical protein ACX9R5_16405 [Rathayibacter sp. CAU 1779]
MTEIVTNRRDGLEDYLPAAHEAGEIDDLLARLPNAGADVPLPGRGRTVDRFSGLATAGFTDMTAARVLEPHLDALAILQEANVRLDRHRSWGVFAAEAPGVALDAKETANGWMLTGIKPWCSLGDRLDAALVTAATGPSSRRLFAVDLRADGVQPVEHEWAAAGLRQIDSGPLRFRDVPATPVGDDDWYLNRRGFAWGGIGVAAVWWGGAQALAKTVADAARQRGGGPLLEHRVGTLWQLLDAARASLERSALLVDSAHLTADEWAAVAHSTRATVIMAVDDALSAVRDVNGPAALAFDSTIARRAADLELYAAQYHRLRDPGAIGRRLLAGDLRW